MINLGGVVRLGCAAALQARRPFVELAATLVPGIAIASIERKRSLKQKRGFLQRKSGFCHNLRRKMGKLKLCHKLCGNVASTVTTLY